jgi:hypothetical protein
MSLHCHTHLQQPAGMAEDHAEDDFYVVHADADSDGTALQQAESLEEKLLVAVRACNQDDMTALLKQGATLHQLAKRTDLTIEMKTVVGESLAALYSAECATDDRFMRTAYQGSFMNTSAPIISSVHLHHGNDNLRLVHADGSLSNWHSEGGYRPKKPFYSFEFNFTVDAQADFVSICERRRSSKSSGSKEPYIAICSKAGIIKTYTKAGVLLTTSSRTNIDSIQTVPDRNTLYSDFFNNWY